MDSSVSYRFALDPLTYMREVYLNPDFVRALYLEGLGFEDAEVLEQSERNGEIRRRLRVRPKMNAPSVIRKVLGATQEYVEDGRLDASGLVWSYTVTPATMAKKMSIGGDQRVSASADGCTATFNAYFRAKIIGVGGAIEKFMVSQFRDNLEAQNTFTKRWIAQNF